MNILDLNYDIMSKIENIIIERNRQKRNKHLDEIHNYKKPFGPIAGYQFRDDDPYEHYVYNGRKYETRCRNGGCKIYSFRFRGMLYDEY
eukprot:SAG11_NODE_18812_length_480_cov_12.152231_2_plen_89_part_00